MRTHKFCVKDGKVFSTKQITGSPKLPQNSLSIKKPYPKTVCTKVGSKNIKQCLIAINNSMIYDKQLPIFRP